MRLPAERVIKGTVVFSSDGPQQHVRREQVGGLQRGQRQWQIGQWVVPLRCSRPAQCRA